MLLTDSEARSTWCHITMGPKKTKCLGAECMAWRWWEHPPQECDDCGLLDAVWVEKPEKRRGYCGLAGKPDM